MIMMASLMPLIQDLLPMILPSSISVTKAGDILPPLPSPSTAPLLVEAEGEGAEAEEAEARAAAEAGKPRIKVISRDAVVNKTDKMCASVLIVKPHSSSSVRHHGEQDAIIYAAAGTGVLLSSPKDEGDEPERFPLEQGDFAVVPSWTEHQALNESEADVLWVIIRSGPSPVEVNLTDWGGDEAKEPLGR
ncbi:hypothetical protein B0T19DRAFT_297647 [Cercophora scortea]|uniref:Cupin type-2 domain-containing protein n=1 Tax=Cercophora scortea TaxID=314031 RepID=A0AAE0I3A5_9PEZI|nr:hypothetical protein B0T19DRAFT_297647 [Cercophora scortea]